MFHVFDPNWNETSEFEDLDAARGDAAERARDWGEAFYIHCDEDEAFFELIEDVDEN